jgi:hypothetical protein
MGRSRLRFACHDASISPSSEKVTRIVAKSFRRRSVPLRVPSAQSIREATRDANTARAAPSRHAAPATYGYIEPRAQHLASSTVSPRSEPGTHIGEDEKRIIGDYRRVPLYGVGRLARRCRWAHLHLPRHPLRANSALTPCSAWRYHACTDLERALQFLMVERGFPRGYVQLHASIETELDRFPRAGALPPQSCRARIRTSRTTRSSRRPVRDEESSDSAYAEVGVDHGEFVVVHAAGTVWRFTLRAATRARVLTQARRQHAPRRAGADDHEGEPVVGVEASEHRRHHAWPAPRDPSTPQRAPSLAQFIRKELRGRRGFSFEAASAKDEE